MRRWNCPKLTGLVVYILAVIFLTSIVLGQETTEWMSADSEKAIENEGLAIIIIMVPPMKMM